MIPRFRPIIPERKPEIFEHPDWFYELKYDGFRAVAYIDGGLCKFVRKKEKISSDLTISVLPSRKK